VEVHRAGGRFAEVAARIAYSVDSGNLSRTKSVDDCLKYIDNDQVPHHFPERQASIHLAKAIRAIYKLRSQRGAVHVSPTYTANEIDSRLIVEAVRWLLADVKGHRELPGDGRENCPLVATRSARWRPPDGLQVASSAESLPFRRGPGTAGCCRRRSGRRARGA
jgi:hypothetical protein